MGNALDMLAFLFFMFLVLAACVEVTLDLFRGLLERFGFTWQRGKFSLDESFELVKEFSFSDDVYHTKVQALKVAAGQLHNNIEDKIGRLNEIKNQAGEIDKNLAAELNEIAEVIREKLRRNERLRISILRFLSVLIGCFIIWWSEFYVFKILLQTIDKSYCSGQVKTDTALSGIF